MTNNSIPQRDCLGQHLNLRVIASVLRPPGMKFPSETHLREVKTCALYLMKGIKNFLKQNLLQTLMLNQIFRASK